MEETNTSSKFQKWWNNNSIIILSLLFSLVIIALGVLCFVAPYITAQILIYVLGGIILLTGIILFIVFFAKGRNEGGYQLVFSIPLIIISIYMFIPSSKAQLNNFLLIILGLFVLIISLFTICKSIAYATLNPTKMAKQEVLIQSEEGADKTYEEKEKPDLFWLWILLSSFIVAGCGIAISFIDATWIIYFVGGTLIFEGVRRFLLALIFRKSIKKCEKLLKEKKLQIAREKQSKENQ